MSASSTSITSGSRRFTSRTPSSARRRKQGVYSGFADWPDRAGRFRSLGDGEVDFGAIFSSSPCYGYDSWAVLEWECAIKNREDGAREGAEFIKKHMIKVSEGSFEDFIDQGADRSAVNRALGIK